MKRLSGASFAIKSTKLSTIRARWRGRIPIRRENDILMEAALLGMDHTDRHVVYALFFSSMGLSDASRSAH